MTGTMPYESLVRRAFRLIDKKMDTRGGDPAEMASEERAQMLFRTERPTHDIAIKATTIYAMLIFKNAIEELWQQGKITESIFNKENAFIRKQIAAIDRAKTQKTFYKLVNDFNSRIIKGYF